MTRTNDYLDEAIVLMVAPWLADRGRVAHPQNGYTTGTSKIAVKAKPEEA